jgi:hypothetical protein
MHEFPMEDNEAPTLEEEAHFKELMNDDDMEVREMYCPLIHFPTTYVLHIQ